MAVTTADLKAWIDANWPGKLNYVVGTFPNRPAEYFVTTLYGCIDTGDVYLWLDGPDEWIHLNAAATGGGGLDIPDTPGIDDILVYDGTNWRAVPWVDALGSPAIYKIAVEYFTASLSSTSPYLIGVGQFKAAGAVNINLSYTGVANGISAVFWQWNDMLPLSNGATPTAEPINYPSVLVGTDGWSDFFLLYDDGAYHYLQREIKYNNAIKIGPESATVEQPVYKQFDAVHINIVVEYNKLKIEVPQRYLTAGWLQQVRINGITACFNPDDMYAVNPAISAPYLHTNSLGFQENYVSMTSRRVLNGSYTVEGITGNIIENHFYAGSSVRDTGIFDSEVVALGSKEVEYVAGRYEWPEIVISSNKFGWFCVPENKGTHAFFDARTGTPIAMRAPEILEVNNEFDFIQSYRCYRTVNPNLGDLLVVSYDV